MKFHAFACGALASGASLLHAGPTETAIVAAMKLPDAPNYTWVTAVEDDARSYTIDGKSDKNDFSYVTMPMVAALRRRSGRGGATESTMTAIYKGDEQLVIESPEGWKKPDEIAASSSGSRGGYGRGGGYGGMGGGGRRGGRGMRGGGPGGDGSERGDNAPPYSNLQLTLSRPHEELAIIVVNAVDMKADGDVVSGRLSETGAKLLLVHAGQKEIVPLKAAGTFRLWVRDGTLTKYEVKLEGTLAVTTRGTRREVEVHQTATTTISAVGTTIVEVPDEARKKLGA